MTQASVLRYEVISTKTGEVLKTYGPNQKTFARRMRDKLDMQYGAVAHSVRIVWSV